MPPEMDLYSVPSGYLNLALRGDLVCGSSCRSHGIALSQNMLCSSSCRSHGIAFWQNIFGHPSCRSHGIRTLAEHSMRFELPEPLESQFRRTYYADPVAGWFRFTVSQNIVCGSGCRSQEIAFWQNILCSSSCQSHGIARSQNIVCGSGCLSQRIASWQNIVCREVSEASGLRF